MGKKNKTSLGRSLVKDRFSNRKIRNSDSTLHTSELNDGYDWGRLNLQSVTEESSFQEFLSTAELAGTEFQAEKLNIKFVSSCTNGLLSKEEQSKFLKDKEEKKDLLKIPRRPKWDENTTAEELQSAEKESFLEWRRKLAVLQEDDNMLLTPYEKNLDFWRQLWRVVERSDVIIQILDARNPLLFRSEDLEKYVHEVSNCKKKNLLLVNKSDFLNYEQRRHWASYFDSIGVNAVFFSAIKELDRNLDTIHEIDKESEENDYFSTSEYSEEENDDYYFSAEEEISPNTSSTEKPSKFGKTEKNSPVLHDRSSLIEFVQNLLKPEDHRVTEGITTIGFVGYPNVGKSSTINALLAEKKVSVSATPGKTKHFQTFFLTSNIIICDCPGLVMPSFVSTKAEMILNGILPIDQMRDHTPPVAMIGSIIPRSKLESHYGILIPRPKEGEDPDRPPSPAEILNAYAYCRGFMTQNGQPDNARAARYILKDFVCGKLLYCVAPPGVDQENYFTFRTREKKIAQLTEKAGRAIGVNSVNTKDIDKEFFKKCSTGVHIQGIKKFGPIDTENYQTIKGSQFQGKSWKDHSQKRNRREKLRRIYRHLDEV